MLSIDVDDDEDGDIIKVCQLGSSDTIFRTSANEYTYKASYTAQEESSED